jgi:hypothetical protein
MIKDSNRERVADAELLAGDDLHPTPSRPHA